MFFLNQKEKLNCEGFGTETTKKNSARLKKRCSVGTVYIGKWLYFSVSSAVELSTAELTDKLTFFTFLKLLLK